MPIHIEAVNPLVAHVRSLPGVNYLTSEIAAATGVQLQIVSAGTHAAHGRDQALPA